jgi:hypothetical protein
MHRRPPPTHPCDSAGQSFTSDRELAEFKKRQQLRESSVEIRELEAQLRQAYINQELALQKKQKQVLAFQRKQEDKLEAQLVEATRRQVQRDDELAERNQILQKIKFKTCLDGQMDEKQLAINRAYQCFLQEKQMIDEIIAQVKAEERNRTIEVLVKKEVEQEGIDDFIESQKIFVVREAERTVAENAQIKAFIAQKAVLSAEQEKVQKERRLIKSDAVQRLGEQLEVERVYQLEQEALLHELTEGRQKDLHKVLERQELEKQIRKRLNLRRANEIASEYRQRLRAAEKAEDDKWKIRIMEESEKAAKVDQMSQTKRRMKVLELKRDAERLLDERKRIRELEQTEEKLFWLEQREAERVRQEMIEDERQNMLKEHAHKLIGFLPTGVLREEDLEMLGREDIRLMYQSRHPVDPLAELESKYASGTNY